MMLPRLFAVLLMSVCMSAIAADKLTIAAASDLRFALSDIAAQFKQQHPSATLELVFGASGKLSSQIQHGAPFDMFFTADIQYAFALNKAGFATHIPQVHAIGRIVLWSLNSDASVITLSDLIHPRFKRIAIAQPEHAPYGLRAKQALISSGVWQQLQPKLVFAENIAQTAQMVQSGAADIGIIALSLAKSPALQHRPYMLIDQTQHQRLLQGYVVTKHGSSNPLTDVFTRYLASAAATNIMLRYGFTAPSDNETKYAP